MSFRSDIRMSLLVPGGGERTGHVFWQLQERGFCVAYDIGDECVGEGARDDIRGRGFQIVGGKENLKLSLGKKGRVLTLTRLAGQFSTPSWGWWLWFYEWHESTWSWFSLITFNPDADIEKAELGLFRTSMMEGKGRKRIKNIGKRELKW